MSLTRKIFGTFGTRVLNAICGFITLWFGSHYLGAEAWGVGGIVLLDVSILLIGVEFIAGGGLVYFTPRKSYRTLMKISYVWSALIVAFYALLFYLYSLVPEDLYVELVPKGYHGMVLLLVFIYSLHNFNLNTLLGKERVGTNNILFIIQFMTQMLSMLFYIFVLDIRDADAFVFSLLTGYAVGYLCGLTQIWRYLKGKGDDSILPTIKEMFRFGAIMQTSTLVTMLNRRLGFQIIKGFWGDANVGVYNAATQVSEAPKMIGHSIAMVQFSKISNITDDKVAARLTVQLLKTATVLTAICVFIVCLIPTSVYSWLFTADFAKMRAVMVALAPGVVFMAANMVFCHYFLGVNMPKHNLYGALAGLAVTIPSLYILIPPFGIVGAGVSASITHLATIVYQWLVFKRINKISVKEILVTNSDLKMLFTEIKNLL